MGPFLRRVNRGLATLAEQCDVDPFLNFAVRIGFDLESLAKRNEDECDQADQNDEAEPRRCCHKMLPWIASQVLPDPRFISDLIGRLLHVTPIQ